MSLSGRRCEKGPSCARTPIRESVATVYGLSTASSATVAFVSTHPTSITAPRPILVAPRRTTPISIVASGSIVTPDSIRAPWRTVTPATRHFRAILLIIAASASASCCRSFTPPSTSARDLTATIRSFAARAWLTMSVR